MKKTLFSLFLLGAVVLQGKAAQEVKAPLNVYGRSVTSLNGMWKYFVDQQDIGYYDYRMNPTRWGFFLDAKPRNVSDLVEYSFDDSKSMKVPGDWNTQDEQLYWYEGSVWYRQKFNWKPEQGRKALLYFAGANYLSRVWVNGKQVGVHEGGFTPFCFDVSDVVKAGENTVVVMVNNNRKKENIPTQIFDWWNYGGITRDVMMVSVPETYIEDYSLQLVKGNTKLINVKLKLNEKKAGKMVTLSIPELKIKKKLVTDAQGEANVVLKAKPSLWCPENPKLYKVSITTAEETISDEIGFRTIETRGKQILLNGKPIFLKGISSHEETAYTSRRCNSAEDADTLLAWAKDLGCNFMRLAHYPHNEHAIREAERKGVLLWEEIPCYWTIDWKNEKTFANAKRQLQDMIGRDKNRANVIVWSVANETPHSAERDKFLSELAKFAKTEDDTRLISMAMEVTGQSNYVNRLNDNMNKYVDIISFNEYIGWYRDVNDAPKMKWEVPYDKPVIISEFGGGAVAGLHGSKNERWTEEFQENLYKENLDMLSKIEGLSGMTPWVLKDFRSPRRINPVVQKDFNRKGLVSDKGKRKKAFYVLKEWYKNK
ncbi:MAG: beta galactosidase jelly roll domain-containing protein [Prevotella sp.]|jgi:beta-glucuronidase|nr:beta galactosidase jelly roll domain-containing protein [Prevotella sp.]